VHAEINLPPVDIFMAKHVVTQFISLCKKDAPVRSKLLEGWNREGLLQDRFRKCCKLLGLVSLTDIDVLLQSDYSELCALVDKAVLESWCARWRSRNIGVDCDKSPLQTILPDLKEFSKDQWLVNGIRSCKQDQIRCLLRLEPHGVEVAGCSCLIGLNWRYHLFFECPRLSDAREILRRCFLEDETLRPMWKVDEVRDLKQLVDIVSLESLLGVGNKASINILKKMRIIVNRFLYSDNVMLVEENNWFVKTKKHKFL